MKNKLHDLGNHLFLQLERLQNESLSDDELRAEIGRAGAIAKVSEQLIAAGRLGLDAARHAAGEITRPPLLGLDEQSSSNDA